MHARSLPPLSSLASRAVPSSSLSSSSFFSRRPRSSSSSTLLSSFCPVPPPPSFLHCAHPLRAAPGVDCCKHACLEAEGRTSHRFPSQVVPPPSSLSRSSALTPRCGLGYRRPLSASAARLVADEKRSAPSRAFFFFCRQIYVWPQSGGSISNCIKPSPDRKGRRGRGSTTWFPSSCLTCFRCSDFFPCHLPYYRTGRRHSGRRSSTSAPSTCCPRFPSALLSHEPPLFSMGYLTGVLRST